MGYKVVFSDEAIKDIERMDEEIAGRIIKKMKWFVNQDNPLSFAVSLKYRVIGEYRYRVGDYRVIFDYDKNKILVLRVGHRSTIYK